MGAVFCFRFSVGWALVARVSSHPWTDSLPAVCVPHTLCTVPHLKLKNVLILESGPPIGCVEVVEAVCILVNHAVFPAERAFDTHTLRL